MCFRIPRPIKQSQCLSADLAFVITQLFHFLRHRRVAQDTVTGHHGSAGDVVPSIFGIGVVWHRRRLAGKFVGVQVYRIPISNCSAQRTVLFLRGLPELAFPSPSPIEPSSVRLVASE